MVRSTILLVFFLVGLAVSLANVLAPYPTPQQAEEDMARFMDVLHQEQDSRLTRFNDILGNARTIIDYKDAGFSGARGIFQWMTSANPRNDGIYNFMQFYTSESSGYMGLQNWDKSSKFTVLFSIWDASGAQPGENFDCTTFGGEGIGYKCFNYDYPLVSNAIYYLDVEIDGSVFRGYISDPQEDLSNVTSRDVPRHLIGEISTPHGNTNLFPYAYYNENYKDKDSCLEAFELVTVNQAPRQYTDDTHSDTSFTEAYLYSSVCEAQNILVAITADKQSTIYFTRPTALNLAKKAAGN